jgi:hypothetical protein
MISRQSILRGAVAGVVVTVFAGCAQMRMGGGAGGMSSGMETYRATLSGSQEVPPVSTSGSGNAEVMVNPSTMAMTYRVTYTGLTGPATAGHIHGPAPAGQNAGVQVPFATATPSPLTGSATLTAAQYADLKAGRHYVNIHTAAHPGGEIRGQLVR